MIDKLSGHHASAALRWFNSMREKNAWGLRVNEQLVLLGGIKSRTYQRWRRQALLGKPVDVPSDTLERLSVLVGIYSGLKTIAPSERPDIALRWFSTPNSAKPFYGVSPKQYAISDGSLDALYSIRRYLESAIYSH